MRKHESVDGKSRRIASVLTVTVFSFVCFSARSMCYSGPVIRPSVLVMVEASSV